MSLEVASHIISRNDIEKVDKIGSGTFGDVFLAIHRYTKQKLAVKILKQPTFNKFDQISFMREVEILASIKYPSILPFIGFSLPNPTRNEHPAITTLYSEGGSLDSYINSIENGKNMPQWGPTQKTIEIIGIAAAMRYLHKKGIIHRDLKPANVLLNGNFEPFVCDFGLSKFIGPGNDDKFQTTNCGTPVFMAPELFCDKPYSKAVDVYAYAMTLYNILTCKTPFKEVQNYFALPMRVGNGGRPSIPETVPKNYKQLIEQCWAQDPHERPTFDDIFKQLATGNFNLPGSDPVAVSNYISMLKNAEVKTIEEYQEENERLKMQVKELQRQLGMREQCTTRIGAAQRAVSSMKDVFDKKIIYGRSSFDIHRCLSLRAPGFFGISGSPNLFVQFNFQHPVVVNTVQIVTYDLSFSQNWTLYAIDSNGEEKVAFSCKDPPPNIDPKKFAVAFTPIEAKSLRIEKTGLPNSLSFKAVEFLDKNKEPVFEKLIQKYGIAYKIPVHIEASNYTTNHLYAPTSELEVFTQNKESEWLQLEMDHLVMPTGYRIKRDTQMRLRGWDLVASVDGKEWTILDKKKEEKRGELGRISEIDLKVNVSFRYFRLVPNKSTWVDPSPYNIFVCNFDVFE